jgi:hypothetical protein
MGTPAGGRPPAPVSEYPRHRLPPARAVHIVLGLYALRASGAGGAGRRGWRVAGRDVSLAVPAAATQAAEGVPVEARGEARQVPARFRVLDAELPAERARWREVWRRWPAREVMADPDFERLFERLEGQFAFVHAIAGGRVVSSELALISRRNVYAFLGGTSLDAFRHYPNELVRDATIEWAIAEGKERYVLGGGRTPDDGILRHKRLLAPGRELPFRTARLVHDPVASHALAQRRALAELEHGGWTPRPGFFPAYRA